MKNTKLTKILIFALSLVLMIGAAVGISASAEEESLTIVSQNVSYEGKTHLYYAVHYENVASPEDISLVVTYTDDEGELRTVTVTESEEVVLKDSENRDVVCRAFRTPGVDAKNFTKVFTVKAIIGETESTEKTYSVAEYCHQWLAYLAGVDEPSEKELKIKAACEATLAYGTKIQALLDYYPNGNTEDYPESYVYVKGADGVTVNGAKAACVIKGAEVSLGYTGTDSLLGWEVYDLEGNKIAVTDGKFTANAYITASPKLTDAKGEYYLSAEAGRRLDYDTITEIDSSMKTYSGTVGSYSIVDGSLLFEDGNAESTDIGMKFWLSYASSFTSATNRCEILEFDFKLTQSYGSYPIQVKMAGVTYTLYFAKPTDTSLGTGYMLCMLIDGAYVPLGCPINTWNTIRFEHYYDAKKLKVFVDNEFVFDIATSAGSTGDSPRITLTSNERKTGSNADLYLDNIYVGHILKDYVEGDPKAAE